jgi:hypothetical protein
MYVYIHISLTSTLAGGEWSVSRTGRFTPGERAPGTHSIGGWVDARDGLDDVENILFLTETRTPIPRPSSSYAGSSDREWSVTFYSYAVTYLLAMQSVPDAYEFSDYVL